MAAKAVLKIVLIAAGLVVVWLGVSNALAVSQSCFLGICLTNPFGWVPGLVVAVIGVFVLWLGVRV